MENFLYDLQYQMYHEARHYYQSMIIADFHARGKSKELPATIEHLKSNGKKQRREPLRFIGQSVGKFGIRANKLKL